ncbi:hypothetical protein R1sor_023345 [Riccia sorocarpa]|uniref:non-specific serine/threonine protein kinase n=1 Tax=Riccia sorocarpa TaxID=122646 RepID=A0ABD3GTD7_9MARC
MAGGKRNKRGGKSKQRQSAAKEKHSDYVDRSDELAEELTALRAIFGDDFKLVSEKPFVEFSINLRPHTAEDEDCHSAELLVRCLPGYPLRAPKLQVSSQTGLTAEQLQYLHSMLVEQAVSLAREGRVMIFDLTEAAQEFLSDQHRVADPAEQLVQVNEIVDSASKSNAKGPLDGTTSTPFDARDEESEVEDSVYLDLFNNLWGAGDVPLETAQASSSRDHLPSGELNNALREKKSTSAARGGSFQETKSSIQVGSHLSKLPNRFANGKKPVGFKEIVEEDEAEDEAVQNIEHEQLVEARKNHSASASEFLRKVHSGLIVPRQSEESSGNSDSSSTEDTIDTAIEDGLATYGLSRLVETCGNDSVATQCLQKDLVLSYLLQLVCGPRGPLSDALPALASELRETGVLSQWAYNLVAHQSQLLIPTFRRMFGQMLKETDAGSVSGQKGHPVLSRFWSANPELFGTGADTAKSSSSRYSSDFEEISLLGKGGFGHVVLCMNKLDGRRYAMKKIKLKHKSPVQNDKILREVATLSSLQHHHVVRYYQAWIETEVGNVQTTLRGPQDSGGSDLWSIQESESVENSSRTDAGVASGETIFLYIQMEYCPRTLRQVFDTCTMPENKDEIWRIFRQLVEGLAHIHGQGIIHRDLNPNNIFFDARGDIKIGDFGLAKFTNLEQPDRDTRPIASEEVVNLSSEGTGQVGTYFYTAPEVEQGLPHVDVKVDMYSLGVVFFELWTPFGTQMERLITLNELKLRGQLPPNWSSPEFAQQAELVRWLLKPYAPDRPTAAQVLRSELLPPRMANESLNDILRTIQKAEDTSVYDQIIAAIFDDERIIAKPGLIDGQLVKLKRENKDRTLVNIVGYKDRYLEAVKDVFLRHGAQRLETSSFSVVDDPRHIRRQVVKLLDSSGNMLDVRHETRPSLARWAAVNQVLSLKSYEMSPVFRKGVADNAPREYLQGDFDIIGGARILAEAEVVKVAVEVVNKFCYWDALEIRINHRQILSAVWSWTGVQSDQRQKVAQVLAMMGTASPQSSARKALWALVRRQLLQSLHIPEPVVDKLQTVERRLSGSANDVLPRLIGALPKCSSTADAIEEVSTLLRYLRVWQVEKLVLLDVLMAATEDYYSGMFFQVHVHKTGNQNRNIPGACVAVGGRYDKLIRKFWTNSATNPAPGAVGLSIPLQFLLDRTTSERGEGAADVLVCSKGGGGLLEERMEIVNDLWTANIKAEYMCKEAPSLTEQYGYAQERGIKWLVIITEASLSLAESVKVRHLDFSGEEDVPREDLVKYFSDMGSTYVHFKKKASVVYALEAKGAIFHQAMTLRSKT